MDTQARQVADIDHSVADDDRALVRRFRQGENQALATLTERYRRPLHQAALSILRRAEDAADVTQTAFLRAAECIADYDPRYKFFSWIYRIAINEAINLRRQHGPVDALDDDAEFAAQQEGEPPWRLNTEQRARRLHAALKGLAIGDRKLLTLRHFADQSHQQIALAMGLDKKLVKSRLFDARQRLRVQLVDLADSSPHFG